jgi:hypothetical protein
VLYTAHNVCFPFATGILSILRGENHCFPEKVQGLLKREKRRKQEEEGYMWIDLLSERGKRAQRPFT